MPAKDMKYALILLFLLPVMVSAQTNDTLLWRNYQFVKQADPWITTSNAAALTRFNAPSIAEAELSLSVRKGGLTRYYDSPDVLQAGAAVEAFQRLNKRIVVFGDISYDNYSGNDMSGSAFINPERKPFDITETTEENAGRKHRDTYQLTGAVGVDFWRGYALGARLDYTAANYAKYKDLRHKNKLMDLTFSAGVYAPVLPWMSIGANYTYHRNTESISFSTYGKSEKIYQSLINYGAFFGTKEQFGNVGYTDKSREMPLFEDNHGADFQLELRPLQQLTLLGSFGFSRGDGYYGRRSPYTATYTQHKRNKWNGVLTLIYQPLQASSRHRLDITYLNEKVANKAETFRELVNSAGAYYYEYYDPVETADKQWQDCRIAYTAWLGICGETPAWELRTAWKWGRQEQLNYLFPYYRHQSLITNEVSLGATRKFICRRGVWTCSLDAAFRKGSGEPFDDHTYLTPDAKQEAPATMDTFLARDYQYLVSSQYAIGGSVKYAFLFPGTRLKTHVGIALSHRKANETFGDCGRNDRTEASVTLGCTF